MPVTLRPVVSVHSNEVEWMRSGTFRRRISKTAESGGYSHPIQPRGNGNKWTKNDGDDDGMHCTFKRHAGPIIANGCSLMLDPCQTSISCFSAFPPPPFSFLLRQFVGGFCRLGSLAVPCPLTWCAFIRCPVIPGLLRCHALFFSSYLLFNDSLRELRFVPFNQTIILGKIFGKCRGKP